MDARSRRWTEVTPSAFAHELAALEQVRDLLPDTYPYAAWSNFSFVSLHGAVREVDLFVLTPTGPVLLELKDWRGELTTPRGSGVWVSRHGGRDIPRDNPLILANQKAKELKSLLERAARREGRHPTPRLPYVRAAVFFSNPSMTCRLPDEDLHHLYGPPSGTGGLPGVDTLLTAASGPPVDPAVARAFPELMTAAGISRTRASMQVGPWELEPRPFDDGPTWQDYHATHQSMPGQYRRIRIYLTAKGADAEQQRSIREAAQREFAAARGITHPAILVPNELAQHEAGPALVLENDRDAQRLDQYLATAGRGLGLAQRVDLLRDIAEAVRYAHSRALVHRALSARAILVQSSRGDSRPLPKIGDWQVAARGSAGAAGTHLVEVTLNADRHLDPASSPYLAPEFREGTEGAVSLDVYGLGTLAYLILTGRPPAADQAGVLQRLQAGTGLHPAAVDPSIPDDLDALVAMATAPDLTQRIESSEQFLELLADALPRVTMTPADGAPVDPLDVVAGGRMPDGTAVVRVLGTGSSARAFLVNHSEVLSVYKVARSEAAEQRLDAEFRALDGLRHENIAGVRRGLFGLGTRSAIEVDFAGRDSVASRLREEGEFLPDQLEPFGRQLIDAVAYLERKDVFHRDIKPDNIGIFEQDKQRTRLVLFDFSLAGVPLRRLDAGTRGYLDPWLGQGNRPEFDRAAERYAVAATLHEMASLLVPEEATEPGGRHVIVASDLFAAPLRAALTSFFHRAFDPDTDRRFDSAAAMGRAWSRVFAEVDQTLPATTTGHEGREPADAREGAADRVGADTPLDAAGLSPRAVTVAQRLGAQTVNDLMLLNNRALWTARGLSRATRTELVQRRGQWRIDLDVTPVRRARTAPTRSDAAQRDDASATLVGVDPLQYPVDVLAERLVPPATGRANSRIGELTRGLLGLDSPAPIPAPAPDGSVPAPPPDGSARWPTNREVAEALGVTPGRISQVATQARTHWSGDEVLTPVVAETVDILRQLGRVAEIDEIAGQLLLRHGSTEPAQRTRLAQARAVLRAVVGRGEDAFRQRRIGSRVLLALEVGDDDPADTPSAPGLLDAAAALGAAADRLATGDPLPAPATVVQVLRSPAAQAGLVVGERRLVDLAVAASDRALAGPRLEVYPRELSPVRALRLAQAGAGLPKDGLTAGQVRDRVSARLPGLAPLPDGAALLELLGQAGFLVRADGDQIFAQPPPVTAIAGATTASRTGAAVGGTWTGGSDADGARVGDADDRLRHTRATGGFRVVTARLGQLASTRQHLSELLGVPATDATRAFLAGVRRWVRSGRFPRTCQWSSRRTPSLRTPPTAASCTSWWPRSAPGCAPPGSARTLLRCCCWTI